jgi:signal transduction histidine kinase
VTSHSSVVGLRTADEPTGQVHVVPERRLRVLTDLLAHAAVASRPEHVCALAVETLAAQRAEFDFARVYLRDPAGQSLRMCAVAGAHTTADWPLDDAVAASTPVLVEDRSAVLVPLRVAEGAPVLGVLVIGVEQGRAIDDAEVTFSAQIGQHIAATLIIANMQLHAERQVRIVALQDHALQTFFVIGLLARAALAELAPNQITDNVAAALVHIMDAATHGRERLREGIFALGNTSVGQSGPVSGLHTLARNFQERTGIDAELLVTGAERNLSPEAAEVLHHAAAEALANIEQHSRAGAVVLSLNISRKSVTLSIQDDGVGVVNPALERIASSATYFGLRGVGERVRRQGGTFVARPSRDGGFLVRTRLPLRPAVPDEAAC